MDYAEVQKYATLYSYQEFLIQQQQRALEGLSAAIGIFNSSAAGDLTKAPKPEIERFREQVIFLSSMLLIEEQLARGATDRYKKALE